MIPKETVQTIIETARVEEVISDFITLQRRGVNYIARCPFHDEKTPSFVVSPVKGIYKCFGCGQAGNSVKFVMEHEQFSFPEALKYLAKKYNIEVEEEEQTPEQIEADNQKELQYNIHTFAQKYFTQQLFESEEGKTIGLSYFKERDFLEKTTQDFHLGYAPKKSDSFYQHALKKGYKAEHLAESGIVIEKDGRYFDRFAGRVLFPIHSLSGRVIGFGGRILDNSSKMAKYLNSPETLIYSKSKVLYGMYFAKKDIIKQDNCYLVEGYTDVISMHQTGIKNVIASSGTSLTKEQIKLIQRYTKNITILYDGDPAGIKASFRGIDMILEQGMNVKILLFEEGQDPDTFVRTHRSSEVLEILQNNTEDFIQFKTRLLLEESKKDPIKKAALIKDIVKTISLIPDNIIREVYIKECSTIMEIPEPTLILELNSIFRQKHKKNRQEESLAVPMEPIKTEPQKIKLDVFERSYQEKDILRLVFNYGKNDLTFVSKDEHDQEIETVIKLSDFVLNSLLNYKISFKNTLYQQILEKLLETYVNEKEIDNKDFINNPDDKISSLAIDLMMTKYEISENWQAKGKIRIVSEEQKLEKAATKSLQSLAEKVVKQQIEEKKDKLKELSPDSDEQIEILKEIMEKEIEWRNLYKELGRIIAP